MRWVRYRSAAGPRLGVVVGDQVNGSTEADLVQLLVDHRLAAAGEQALGRPVEVLPLDEANLMAPVHRPPAIRDFMAFEQHVEGMAMLVEGRPTVPDVWYDQPLFYFSNPASVVGPHDEVAVPPGCAAFDFELEVAAVIGMGGGDLTLDDAARSIAGYVLMNDWSARDVQAREMQGPLGPCKGKDSAITLGPWFVSADELPGLATGEPTGIELRVAVNGTDFGGAPLDSLGWTFAEMASYASRGTRLRPGDVLGSGTCGDGCLAERWGRRGRDSIRPLQPGDVVTMTGGPLGRIANRVTASTGIRQPLARRESAGTATR